LVPAAVTELPVEEKPMSNRHTHKKLRAEARRLAAATGEGYQHALQRIRMRTGAGERSTPRCEPPSRDRSRRHGAQLVAVTYFGRPATLATFEFHGRPVLMLVPHPFQGRPFPSHSLQGWTTFGGQVLA
jgi:hypothetical protein